jgi:hypothetical protein
MKLSVFMSLRNLGYDVIRLGSGWPGLSEMWAYKDGCKSPDAVYNGRRKTLVYRGLDKKMRSALGEIASGLSFAYPLKIDDDRVVYCSDGEVNITDRKRNTALHELIMGK